MLLKTMFMAIMSSSLLVSSAWSECCNIDQEDCASKCCCDAEQCNVAHTQFSRTVVLERDTLVPPNSFPVDPNHEAMVASGLYTQLEADANTNDAIQFFINLIGFDFSANNPTRTVDADGIITITTPSLAQLVPTAISTDNSVFVLFDSEHPERGKKNNQWYAVEYGNDVLFLSSGTFKSGLFNGASYSQFDALTYADLNLLKCGHNRILDREVIRLRSANVGIIYNSQWPPDAGYVYIYNILDEFGNKGIKMGSTNILRDPSDPVNGPKTYRERDVMTWIVGNEI